MCATALATATLSFCATALGAQTVTRVVSDPGLVTWRVSDWVTATESIRQSDDRPPDAPGQEPSVVLQADRLSFDGVDLLRASPRVLRGIRGARISLVLQDPKYSLNPVMTVGEQIDEAARIHLGLNAGAARRKTLEMLEAVRIRDPERVVRLHPHEVSGGMGQRIMIAMMLVPEPDLLIADEPTSALDVTVQMQVLTILDDLVTRRGMGLIFISHDLDLVASFCDRVLVMYAGRVLEERSAGDLASATHPYTQGLLRSLPRIGEVRTELPTLDRDAAWLEG